MLNGIIFMAVVSQSTVWMNPIEVWSSPESLAVSRLRVDSTAFELAPSSISSALRGAGIPGSFIIHSGVHNLNNIQIRGGSASGTKVLFNGMELNTPIDPSFNLWLIPSFFVKNATVDLTARGSFYGMLELNSPTPTAKSSHKTVFGTAFYDFCRRPQIYFGLRGTNRSLSYGIWADVFNDLITVKTNSGTSMTPEVAYERYAGFFTFRNSRITESMLLSKGRRRINLNTVSDLLGSFSVNYRGIIGAQFFMKRTGYTGGLYEYTWRSSGVKVTTKTFSYKYLHIRPSFSFFEGNVTMGYFNLVPDVTRLAFEIDNGLTVPINEKAVLSVGAPLNAVVDLERRRFYKPLPYASIEFRPLDALRLRAAYSHVWHLPKFYDLYVSGGNPNLIPEEGDEVETGIDFNLNSSSKIGVVVYGRWMKQLVEWVQDTINDTIPVFLPRNTGEAFFKGADLYLQHSSGPISVRLGASLIQAKDKNGNPLPFVANVVSASFMFREPHGLYGGLKLEYTSDHRGIDFVRMQEVDCPGYIWSAVTLGYSVPKDFKVELGVDNLLGSPAEFKPGYPMPGRSFRFGIDMRL